MQETRICDHRPAVSQTGAQAVSKRTSRAYPTMESSTHPDTRASRLGHSEPNLDRLAMLHKEIKEAWLMLSSEARCIETDNEGDGQGYDPPPPNLEGWL